MSHVGAKSYSFSVQCGKWWDSMDVDGLYTFKSQSRLEIYLKSKCNFSKTKFTLREILYLLRDIIKNEELFDKRNPAVIICSPELEESLDLKALHVTQIKHAVIKQLNPMEEKINGRTTTLSHKKSDTSKQDENCKNENIQRGDQSNKYRMYVVRPPLLRVLRTLPRFSQHCAIFTYEYISRKVVEYILLNKERFFDKRNVTLAILKDDPLGIAFNVYAFHKSQFSDLLMKQIIPLNQNYSAGTTISYYQSSSSVSQYYTEHQQEEDDEWVVIDLSINIVILK